MAKKEQIILLIFLIAFCFSLAAPVLALDLELKYPTVPGLKGLEEIKGLEPSEQLTAYARYILRLIFFIVLGICVVVLIAAGVLYLVAFQKPVVIVTARNMVQRTLLGLFILLTSYLVLYTINPQLLIFKVGLEKVPPAEEVALAEYPPEAVGYVAVPFFDIPPDFDEKVGYDPDKEVYVQDGFLTDGFDNFVDEAGEYLEEALPPTPYVASQPYREGLLAALIGAASKEPQRFVYQAEIPFLKTEKVLAKVIELIEGKVDDQGKVVEQGIVSLLENCKCGDSYWKIIWEGIEGKCITHMGYLQAVPPEEGGQAVCRGLCDDCGTKKDSKGYFLCDIRGVRIGPATVTVKIGGKDENKVVELTEVEVKKGTWKYLPDKVKPIGWEPPAGWRPGKWDDPETRETKDVVRDGDKVRPERLIKYRVLQLQELLAELKAQEPQFAAKQFDFLGNTLKINAADFLLAESEEIKFGYDFAAQKESFESQGFDVQIEVPKHLEPTERGEGKTALNQPQGLFASLATLINPFLKNPVQQPKISAPTAYIPKYGLVFDEKTLERNALVLGESQRASLFSVLTGLSLEAIEGIFKNCLTLAFGIADYQLPKETVEFIKKAVREGVADRFIAVVAEKLGLGEAWYGFIKDGMTGAIAEDVEDDLIRKCAQRCKDSLDPEERCVDEECEKGMLACSQFASDIEAEKRCLAALATIDPCVKKCKESTIPPHIVSETIANFFTQPIKERLTKGIQETLDEKLREAILSKRLDDLLKSKMIDLYNKVVDKALSKSFIDLISPEGPGKPGWLQKTLTRRLDTVPFLDRVFKTLSGVDWFLECTFVGCKRGVADKSECKGYEKFRVVGNKKECYAVGLKQHVSKYAGSLAAGLRRETVGRIEGAIQGYKEGHPEDFPEYMTLNDCYSQLGAGYIFEVNQPYLAWMKNPAAPGEAPSPGSCLKLTPEKINTLQKIPRKFDFTDVDDSTTIFVDYEKPISELRKEELCRDAIGQCWQKDTYIYKERKAQPGKQVGGCCDDSHCPYTYDCVDGADEDRTCDFEGGAPTGECYPQEDIKEKLAVKGVNPKCVQCSSLELTQVFTKEFRETLGRDFKAGLINFGEQLLTAFLYIMKDTAIKYAQVWVEDTILAPLRPYLQEASEFRDDFHKFLNLTVQDTLPEVIEETLQSNIDKTLQDLCQQYQEQKTKDPALTKITFDLKFYELGKRLTWKDKKEIEATTSVPIIVTVGDKEYDMGEAVCRLSTHFHTALLHEISTALDEVADVETWLNTKVKDYINKYLCPEEDDPTTPEDDTKCIENFLSKSPAEMLWPKVTYIKQLLEGTPKQLICGEHFTFSEKTGEIEVKLAKEQKSVLEQCKDMRTSQWGILPSFNTESSIYKTIEEKGKSDIMHPWCYFIYGACESPFSLSVLNKPAGEAVEILANALCHKINKDAIIGEPEKKPAIEPKCKAGGDVCLGTYQPNDAMRGDPTCHWFYKVACETCNVFLHNPTAFSVYYHTIKEGFDLTKYGITDHTYPQKLIADSPLAALKAKETRAYQFLLALTPLRSAEIAAVATRRGFSNDEWLALVAEKRALDYFKDLKEQIELKGELLPGEKMLLAFINYFTTEMTPRELLMRIPLGIIKPISKDEKTLLGTEQLALDYNFLSLTLYQVYELFFGASPEALSVCKKIKDDFATDYPDWTMETLAAKDLADLYSKKVLPYSVESLETKTIAKRFDAIFQSPVPGERKLPYLFCLGLDYAPAQILGLDQGLYTYIPEQYQILFQLLNDKLAPQERPKALDQVLTFLFDRTPVDVLDDIENMLGIKYLFSMPWKEFYADQLDGKALKIVIEQELPLPDFWKMLQVYWDGLDRRAVIPDDAVLLEEVIKIMDEYGAQVVTESEVEEVGVPIVPMDLYMQLAVEPPITIEKPDPDDADLWLVKDNRGRQYLVWKQNAFLKVYRVSREGDYAEIQRSVGDIAAFLRTPLRSQLLLPPKERPQWSQVPIIDLLIEDYCKDNYTAKKDIIACINKFHRAVPMERWKEFQALLGKTPIQTLKNYLKKPLVPKPLDDENMSLMAKAAKGSFLGQPYLDTLGRGWLDVGLVKAGEVDKRVRKYVDQGIEKSKDRIKKTFDEAFIEAPQAIGNLIVDGVSRLIGREVSRTLADAVAGACRSKDDFDKPVGSQADCDRADEVFRIKDGVPQCCNMGESLACTPRCRSCKGWGTAEIGCEEEDCVKTSGEVFEDRDEMCCCQIVDDKCKKCRRMNAAQGGKCREGQEKEDVIDGYKVCCHEEELIKGKLGIVEDKCCTTVSECVSNRFADALEVMADMLADGIIPVYSLTGE